MGKLAYLRNHPYFLPCFIASTFAFIAFLAALVGLNEVSMFMPFPPYTILTLCTDLAFGHTARETSKGKAVTI